MLNDVVLSKVTGEYIPIRIKSKVFEATSMYPKAVEYDVYDGCKQIGCVRLQDTDYGCYVMGIENKQQKKYGKFGMLADKLEVQYCMDKGMKDFEICSYADINSHAVHYLRGKRFNGHANVNQIKRFKEIYPDADIKSFGYNTIVNYIIKHTPIGERFNTKFLREIPMYMPKALIRKYVAELLKNPIVL